MELIFYLFGGGLVIVALLATIAIWSPRATRVRALSVVLTACFIPLSYVLYTELLSRPKPISHEWWRTEVASATLLGTTLDEGNAIYLWLLLEGFSEPRYYVLPWRKDLAERLQGLTDDAIASNARIEIKNPFSVRSFDNVGELNVQIAPPPKHRVKPLPPPARIFNPRGQPI